MNSKNIKNGVHILFIVENCAVPTDIRVWREAKTAKQAGYNVSVISPKDQKYSKKFEVIEGIKIFRHPVYKREEGMLSQIIEYANAFLWEVILSFRLFFKSRFDIIHGANPPDNLFVLACIFKIFGVKYIFDHHDLSPEVFVCKYGRTRNLIYYMLKMMEKLSCHTADIVISTNLSFKKHIIDNQKVSPEKIYIVRNDPELPEQEENVKQQENYNCSMSRLLYVGEINTQDGVDLVIRVVYLLVTEFSQKHIRCIVVGDGPALQKNKELCTELGMESYINFLGYIYDRDKLNEYLKEADICLETAPDSVLNRNSTFIKIGEYMAAGKPIVAFDLEETRFTVKDSAILVQPGDIHAYAKAIYKLIKEPLTRKELGHMGLRRIIESLNWERASRQLLSAYKTLIMEK